MFRAGLPFLSSFACATLLSLTASTTVLGQSIDDLLDPLEGTYTLRFTIDADAPDSTPVTNGTQSTFVIGQNQRLCVDGVTLSSPSSILTPSLVVRWANSLSDVRFDLNITDNDPDPDDEDYVFDRIEFFSAAGTLYGEFEFVSFAAGTGTCGQLDTEPTSAQLTSFFSSAQTAFPALFPAGLFIFNQQSDGYTYRYYDSTGIYLAYRDGQIYARGGSYGDTYINVGSYSSLSAGGGINNIARPATIDSEHIGTYEAEMSDTQPFSPIPDGTSVTYVIRSNGQLCLSDGTQLSPPLYLNNNTTNPVWIDTANNRRFSLPDDIDDLAEALLTVQSSGGSYAGELQGDRISFSEYCQAAFPDDADTETIDELFELAEQYYPDLMPGPLIVTRRNEDYYYRYYPGTNVFLAVRDGIVYSGEGSVSFSGTAVGNLETVIADILAQRESYTPDSSLTGTYEMTLSGSHSLSVIPNGSIVRFGIESDGTVCLDNVVFTNPDSPRSTPDEVLWINSSAGLQLHLSVAGITEDLSFRLTTSQGGNLGTLTGQRVNNTSSCYDAPPSTSDKAVSGNLITLAEQFYPDLFPRQTPYQESTASGAYVRRYPGSGVTVSVVGSDVFVRGGEFGAVDYYVGRRAALIAELTAAVDNLPQPPSVYQTYAGTYEMLVSGANPFSPYSNGSLVRVTVGAGGRLCLDDTQLDASATTQALAAWRESNNGMTAALSQDAETGEMIIALGNSRGNSLGVLTGNRINSSEYCQPGSVTATQRASAEVLFDLAEQVYPALFVADSSSSTIEVAGILSRFYAGTSVTLSVIDSEVFIRGGDFGTSDFYAGSLQSVTSELQQAQTSDENQYMILISGAEAVSIGGLAVQARQFDQQLTETLTSSQLEDAALVELVTRLLKDEMPNPQSVEVTDIVRSSSSVQLTATLQRATVIGSTTNARAIIANVTFRLQP
ncbi:MAG: hypothetical protein CMQ46_01645 [Gammaproteobacteria bacterium]|nr:hypothetical protein [Gammaproteobacteria bacterium]MBJ53951.1 hypothetical protein [Gammaproteobacteria bacterium]HBN16084.1 hypothetical protein [Pseudohongiella sp.]